MSYDLTLRPRVGILTEDAFVTYFNEQENVSFPEDEPEVAAYFHPRTEVYFHFRYEPPNRDEPGGKLTFHINFFRPHVFALEAEPVLHGAVEALDLEVEDPQEAGVEGAEFDGEQFLRGWNFGNRLAYLHFVGQHHLDALAEDDALEEDEEDEEDETAKGTAKEAVTDAGADGVQVFCLPRADLQRIWRFNYEGALLGEEFDGAYQVPAVGFAEQHGGLVTVASVDISGDFLLPRVDVVHVQQDAREQAFVAWEDVERALGLTNAGAPREPWPHWAIVATKASRLGPFLRGRLEPAPLTSLSLDKVHALEDIEAARSGGDEELS